MEKKSDDIKLFSDTSETQKLNIENEDIITNTKAEKGMHAKSTFSTLLYSVFHFIFDIFFNFFRFISHIMRTAFAGITRVWLNIWKKHLKKPTTVFVKWVLVLVHPLVVLFGYIKNELFSIGRFWRSFYRVLRDGFKKREKANFLVRTGDMIKAFFCGVARNTRVFITVFNWLLPAAAVIALCFVVQYVSSLNFAVAVTYNGEQIGYISDETVYEAAEARLQSRMVYQSDEEIINILPHFEVVVTSADNLINEVELTSRIISVSSDDIVYASGLTIDDTFYGAVQNGDKIQDYLDSILNDYRTKNPNAVVQFTQDVSFDSGFYVASNIVDSDALYSMISGETQGESYYTVTTGDTPSGIASKNGITLNSLVSLNPDILTNCMPGQKVLIQNSKPFLSVSVLKTISYEESIAYTTEYVDDPSVYKGLTRTIRSGVRGVRAITAEVEYVNGTEVNRTILSSEVTKDPVSARIARGTKPLPSGGGAGSLSSYGFCLPVTGGYVSEYFGWTGTRYHRGLDIAFRGNGYGKTIVAIHSGTVIEAGWHGSYGNLVVLRNSTTGVTTYYAHCSRIAVRVGQSVTQGQYIANIGSTGNSSGNHLHLRVIINGVEYNPLRVLPAIR